MTAICWRGVIEHYRQYLPVGPDYHFLPVGNAGNITAYWRGYVEYERAGKIDRLPRRGVGPRVVPPVGSAHSSGGGRDARLRCPGSVHL